jgi:hypothetical protein
MSLLLSLLWYTHVQSITSNYVYYVLSLSYSFIHSIIHSINLHFTFVYTLSNSYHPVVVSEDSSSKSTMICL